MPSTDLRLDGLAMKLAERAVIGGSSPSAERRREEGVERVGEVSSCSDLVGEATNDCYLVIVSWCQCGEAEITFYLESIKCLQYFQPDILNSVSEVEGLRVICQKEG